MNGETKRAEESEICRVADLPMSGYVDALAYRSAQVAALIVAGCRLESERDALRASNAELREALGAALAYAPHETWPWTAQARAALARTK